MTDTANLYSRGRDVVLDQPGLVLVGLVAAYLLVDLLGQILSGDILISTLAGYLWNGVTRGLIIGLAGIGLSMTYSILNFANFSHGDYITAGAFSGWGVTYLAAGWGSSKLLRIPDTYPDLLLLGAGGSVYGSELGIRVYKSPVEILQMALAVGVVIALVVGAHDRLVDESRQDERVVTLVLAATGVGFFLWVLPSALFAGLVVAGVVTVLIALALDRLVYRPIRGESGITLLIASVGVAFILRYFIVFVFSQRQRGTTDSFNIPQVDARVWDGTVPVGAHAVTVIIAALALMLGVHLLLQRTKLGKAMRAMADNEDLARVTGIPTERVIRWTWIIGGGLSGVSGFLLVLWRGTIDFQFGWLLLLLIFAAVILGGIGSIYGAMAGGLIIGLTIDLSIIWIPSSFNRAAAFAVMILILLFMPQGIFSGRSTA